MSQQQSYVSKADLIKLYQEVDIVILLDTDSKENIKSDNNFMESSPLKLNPQFMTPLSKAIYEYATPGERERLLKDFAEDDNLIKISEEFKNDPDYQEKFADNGLGFYIESFVSKYMLCPICGNKTLLKYAISNMPVIDLICTNKKEHKNGIRFFQVKSKIINLDIPTKFEYFNKKSHISVGSKRFGYNAHMISGKDRDKSTLIGYICVALRQTNDKQTFNIDKKESFALVPDINKYNDEYYYAYHNTGFKEVIQWNPTIVDIYPISMFITKYTVSSTEIISGRNSVNPFSTSVKQISFNGSMTND